VLTEKEDRKTGKREMIAQQRVLLSWLTSDQRKISLHLHFFRMFIRNVTSSVVLVKYFCEDRKLFSRSKRAQTSCLCMVIRKIRACLKRYHYGVVMNKAKEYKNIGHERAEYFLKERIDGKGNASFSLSCYSTDNDIFCATFLH